MGKGLKIFLIIILAIGFVFGGAALLNYNNELMMRDYIDSFGRVEYESQLTPQLDENGVPYFTTDEDFNVMHLTDIHIVGGFLAAEKDRKAINATAAMITEEKPDLVIITGDIAFAVPWGGTINNAYAHRMLIRLMENLGVYWTVALGNHDSESYNYHSRAKVAQMYEDGHEYCLFSSDDGGVYGECNHLINLRNSTGLVTQSFIMMDTNAYTSEDPLGILWIYDNIHPDQIEWYEDRINQLNEYNRTIIDSLPEDQRPEGIEEFESVKSLLFVHIPIMETRDAYNEYLAAGEKDTEDVKYLGGYVGEDAPYVYCSEKEEEMFETMIELGSTKAMFFGHDHYNNIVLEYKGIIFSYGYTVDYFAYTDIDAIGWQRGCSIIVCHPDGSFDISHENYYQDKYQPLYEKEEVDMER